MPNTTKTVTVPADSDFSGPILSSVSDVPEGILVQFVITPESALDWAQRLLVTATVASAKAKMARESKTAPTPPAPAAPEPAPAKRRGWPKGKKRGSPKSKVK